MPPDIFGNFQEAVWNAIRSAVRVGTVGRANADGTTTIAVEGRPHYIYVRTGATQTGGEILEAYNKGIPRLAGAPVLLIKWNRVWTVVGVDADSPAVTATTYSVAYHRHLRDNGLAQSVLDLEGMPSTLAGRGGALLRVNDDEDGFYLADADSGGTGTVDSVNGETGTVVLDSDDIAEGATNLYMSAAEETKLAGIEALADVTDAANVGGAIHGATAKTTPVDADTMPLIDSAASNVLKKVTWANIKATLKTYFDTLYGLLGSANTWTAINTFSSDIVAGVVRRDNETGSLHLMGGTSDTQGPYIQLIGKDAGGAADGSIQHIASTESSALGDHIWYSTDGTTFTEILRLAAAGNLFVQRNNAFVILKDASGSYTGFIGIDNADTLRIENDGHDVTVQNAATVNAIFKANGRVGLGVSSPQGRLHIYDGTTGKLVESKLAVAGTPITVIPDGTGDVTAALFFTTHTKSSGGTVQTVSTANMANQGIAPGAAAVTIYSVGSDIVTLTVNANGSVTIVRTGGSLTYTVSLDLFWQ